MIRRTKTMPTKQITYKETNKKKTTITSTSKLIRKFISEKSTKAELGTLPSHNGDIITQRKTETVKTRNLCVYSSKKLLMHKYRA